MKQYLPKDKPTSAWRAALKSKKYDLPELTGNETREELAEKIIAYLRGRKGKK